MSQRPKDWEDTVKHILSDIGKIKGEPYPILIQDGIEWDVTKRRLIEAGADAMSKALLEWLDEHLGNNQITDYTIVSEAGKPIKVRYILEKDWQQLHNKIEGVSKKGG